MFFENCTTKKQNAKCEKTKQVKAELQETHLGFWKSTHEGKPERE